MFQEPMLVGGGSWPLVASSPSVNWKQQSPEPRGVAEEVLRKAPSWRVGESGFHRARPHLAVKGQVVNILGFAGLTVRSAPRCGTNAGTAHTRAGVELFQQHLTDRDRQQAGLGLLFAVCQVLLQDQQSSKGGPWTRDTSIPWGTS